MVESMSRFEHGGDVYTHPDVVDFSANLNPLGMPQEAVEALASNVDLFSQYPDPKCRKLVEKIAIAEQVNQNWVVCTAGATDLMTRVSLAFKPKLALVVSPCYSGYEQALELSDTRVSYHMLSAEKDYRLTDALLDDMHQSIDLLIIASPNNPTGITVESTLLRQILSKALQLDMLVMLDECFLDLTSKPSAVALCESFPNLIVMKAFTKTYAMAGLRLGYGICSDADAISSLKGIGQPWAVSVPAQIAGCAALDAQGFIEKSRAYISKEREYLACALKGFGFRVIPGEANYLMFLAEDIDLHALLLNKGIQIRKCENYRGLNSFWYRVAVRTHEQNQLLVAALNQIASEGEGTRR